MNDPVLLLDSTVLVAYELDLTRRAQAVVLEVLADGRLMGDRVVLGALGAVLVQPGEIHPDPGQGEVRSC